jgi:hypothetical protein
LLLGSLLVRTKLLNASFLGQESPLSMNCKKCLFFFTFCLQKPIALCFQLKTNQKPQKFVGSWNLLFSMQRFLICSA